MKILIILALAFNHIAYSNNKTTDFSIPNTRKDININNIIGSWSLKQNDYKINFMFGTSMTGSLLVWQNEKNDKVSLKIEQKFKYSATKDLLLVDMKDETRVYWMTKENKITNSSGATFTKEEGFMRKNKSNLTLKKYDQTVSLYNQSLIFYRAGNNVLDAIDDSMKEECKIKTRNTASNLYSLAYETISKCDPESLKAVDVVLAEMISLFYIEGLNQITEGLNDPTQVELLSKGLKLLDTFNDFQRLTAVEMKYTLLMRRPIK